MGTSVWGDDVRSTIDEIRTPSRRAVQVDDAPVEVPTPFPSPQDWRDTWIYFLLVDRFHNPDQPPNAQWDGEFSGFQGGTLEGVRRQLAYLQHLGVGAIWLSPVLKNCRYDEHTYHGYGIQDFLAVDPRFAANPADAEGELKGLVDEAHARGMYVILDIVLNHAGDVFAYDNHGSTAPWRDHPYPVRWRDETGQGRQDWPEPPVAPPADSCVWPDELRRNAAFRRQGRGGELGGDFESLKELVTDLREATPERGPHFPVRDTLIRAYHYAIARYDVDGFRIDTLKYVEREFALIFGNAMREFALSIGKRNFFTFGEVYDNEEQIARFIGRTASDPGDLVGVDAALDFPLFYTLPWVAKGHTAPADLTALYAHRKDVQRDILSSHGEAGRYFVTFLDNHDQKQRFYYQDPSDPHRYDAQVTLALGCLFALQGIPCVYYGTEQGLHGAGDTLEAVREALWGRPGGFDAGHPFHGELQALAALRAGQPALRYGRQYFRPISGDGSHFGISPYPGGVLAVSRILNDDEVVAIANTDVGRHWGGEVIVDYALNRQGVAYEILHSNRAATAAAPGTVAEKAANAVQIREPDGRVTYGPARALGVQLQPMEIQILRKATT